MTFLDTEPAAAAAEAPNFERAFALRPEVFDAWNQLCDAVAGGMELRRYELVTLAAARRLRSSYCMLSHGSKVLEELLGADELHAVVTDHRAAGLDEAEVAAMELAGQVVADATAVTQADVDRLRELGLSDTDIFDVVVTAALRCFFSKTLDALGVLPDASYATRFEPALRDALTVGRPIAGR